jgi:hypothetical protein
MREREKERERERERENNLLRYTHSDLFLPARPHLLKFLPPSKIVPPPGDISLLGMFHI